MSEIAGKFLRKYAAFNVLWQYVRSESVRLVTWQRQTADISLAKRGDILRPIKELEMLKKKVRAILHYRWAVLIGVFAVGLSGCVGKPVMKVSSNAWGYKPNAVRIQVQARGALNVVNGQSHTLVLGVFQLSDPGKFSVLGSTANGLYQLLSGSQTDKSIVNFQRFIIQQGERKTFVLARAAGAKYVALVAGYNNINPEMDRVIFNVPIHVIPQGFVSKLLILVRAKANSLEGEPSPIELTAWMGPKHVTQFLTVTKGARSILAQASSSAPSFSVASPAPPKGYFVQAPSGEKSKKQNANQGKNKRTSAESGEKSGIIRKSKGPAGYANHHQVKFGDESVEWYIQVASMVHQEGARHLAGKLRQARLGAFVSKFQWDGKTYYRVRVGPFATKTGAMESVRLVKRASGLQAVVMPALNGSGGQRK